MLRSLRFVFIGDGSSVADAEKLKCRQLGEIEELPMLKSLQFVLIGDGFGDDSGFIGGGLGS